MYGNDLICAYLFTKLLYLGNAIGQLFMLDVFLGMNKDYRLYGILVMSRMVRGEDWSWSERFPRVTMCDFQVRQMKNVQTYTVQCVLPINLFNEKIFLFIWFWLLFIALSTLSSLIHWTSKVIVLSMQTGYVKRQLKVSVSTEILLQSNLSIRTTLISTKSCL